MMKNEKKRKIKRGYHTKYYGIQYCETDIYAEFLHICVIAALAIGLSDIILFSLYIYIQGHVMAHTYTHRVFQQSVHLTYPFFVVIDKKLIRK